MDKIDLAESEKIAEAVVVWTGWGRAQTPSKDRSLLAAHFGEEDASRLLPLVEKLAEDFYATDARYTAKDLEDMEKKSIAHFSQMHPELPPKASRALAWCYTFDNK